jgi:Mg2+-importing ATPase
VAYVVCLAAALLFTWRHARLPSLAIAAAVFFLVLSALIVRTVLRAPGRRASHGRQVLRPLRQAVETLRQADPRLVRDVRLQSAATTSQLAIVLCDAATMALLIRALGADAPLSGVFASFMLASVLRTLLLIPGGVGVFEAASVVTLRLAGTSVPVALSATLLFRGLSLWLPMLPGAWLARRALRASAVDAVAAPPVWWSRTAADLAAALGTGLDGLPGAEAERRRRQGPGGLARRRHRSRTALLLGQLRNPLLLLLAAAAAVSAASGEWPDALIVAAIVAVSSGVGYLRESQSAAAEALEARLQTRARVERDGTVREVPREAVVPGDVIRLAAGSLVPADAVVLEATDCWVSEAPLTGEAFPVAKQPGVVPEATPLAERSNALFMGTSVRSGTARALVVAAGQGTAYAAIAGRLDAPAPEAEFDRGLRRFSWLLTAAMLLLTALVFVAHVLGGRPPAETLLFAVALAVGLSPELLPAILSINLARGASMLARQRVLVRHLGAIENLGSMDVLCTDKTGTLTEGVVRLDGACDAGGRPSPTVRTLAAENAAHSTGLESPLDAAILQGAPPLAPGLRKLGEIPFDFERRRVGIAVADAGGARLVVKGAVTPVLAACATLADGRALDQAVRAELDARVGAWSGAGIRVLAVATRALDPTAALTRESERDLVFQGFLTFLDRPKTGASEAVRDLSALGVAVKLISGDALPVCQHVAGLVGLGADRVLTGREIAGLDDAALAQRAERTDVFAEVDPSQKERIVRALRRGGHVVGFLGDGINDAPAMHAADAGLSVESAADVAREAADFVLLERDLSVIRRGIAEGRRTFANTLKYVLNTTSANLGNMLSMAAASLVLPFLPLLAAQILLNNFLSDLPAIGIADDSVDPEMVATPRRWDVRAIARFMLIFGVVSSLFDVLAFGVLLRGFHADPTLFRTGWFTESLLTELAVALVLRTQRPCWQSRPGRLLLGLSAVLVPLVFVLPLLPFAGVLGFVRMPAALVGVLALLTIGYVAMVELVKRRVRVWPAAPHAALPEGAPAV